MPAYNAEATILAAVRSTLRAMPQDSELFVGDDASTDRTIEVLQTVRDHRLRIVADDVNRGSGYVRKRLLAESDSEYVAAMDADDIAFPWRFTAQMRAFARADVVFGSVVCFGGADSDRIRDYAPGWIRPSLPLGLLPEEFTAALLIHSPAWHSTLLARREALERAGGYRPLRYGQDYEQNLRVAASGARAIRIGLPVVAYRKSRQQATRKADYLLTIRNTVELGDSYCRLFNATVRAASLDPHCGDPDHLAGQIDAGLRELLAKFRPIPRLYYARLLSSGRPQSWLADQFRWLGSPD
ncbi:MAG: glycosyltransferase family 2 protein [Mycobacterium sp.]|nr:glycosyltransferase family 2 protein [Mycobacterium sp.]